MDNPAILQPPDSEHTPSHKHLLVFEEASGSSSNLIKQLADHNFETSIYSLHTDLKPAELERVIAQQHPEALLFVVDSFNDEMTKVITTITQATAPHIPAIFISSKGQMEQRLGAIRCGSNAFLLNPLDVSSFVCTLDSISHNTASNPYRVMIIDKSATQPNVYNMHLQQDGIHTLVVTDPFSASETVCHFDPELILMDDDMQVCSGEELAAVMRQHTSYANIPIVLLSAQIGIDKQRSNINPGADVVFGKPVQPAYLVQTIKNHVGRYRNLSTLITRDSLTGLLNLSQTEEQLQIELSRAERNQHHLAYAKVDIDNLKAINDHYGHEAGDRVIQSLARLMQKILRKTDIIGRIGGDEYAVLLSNANEEQAFDIMENLRTDFEQIEHCYDNQAFKATFSCGIAFYPVLKHAAELVISAQNALSFANKQGPNRVQLAQK